MNRSWWICILIVPFAAVIIELASGEWLGALLPLALGIFLAMTYRRIKAGERVLDEVERNDELDERAVHDREEEEQYIEALSVLDAREDQGRPAPGSAQGSFRNTGSAYVLSPAAGPNDTRTAPIPRSQKQ